MIDAHAARYIGPKEPEGFMIDGWTRDAARFVCVPPAQNYKTLDAAFLQAMDEIGVYGNEKYGDKSFHAQRANGTLKRLMRTESREIGNHIDGHYSEYLMKIKHDHFGTLRHQLAAAAFNAMMEYVYATVADGKAI